jgi:hypothetical protein
MRIGVTSGGSGTHAMTYDGGMSGAGMSSMVKGNAPSSGGTLVTIVGCGVGGGRSSDSRRYRIGHTAAQATRWVSGSSMEGRVSHGGGGARGLDIGRGSGSADLML